MKKYKYLAPLFAIALAFTSCNDDDVPGQEPLAKPTATTTVTSLTILEGKSDVIPFTISTPVNVPAQFKIQVVGGTGEEDTDITAGTSDTDGDTGIVGEGFEITVPAYATSFEIPVNAIRDLDETEGDETVILEISAAGVRTVLTPQVYSIEVNILDYKYCVWTLQSMDNYGDGWNGAVIELDDNGVISQYATDGANTVFDVTVQEDAPFSFTYIGGTPGGGPGAPGYEEENSYILTAPDGTVYQDGPLPAYGVIVSGTNDMCN